MTSTRAVRRAINATGDVVAPSLGGVPLSALAREAATDAAGYATITSDSFAPARDQIQTRLAALAGAPATVVQTSLAGAIASGVAALADGGGVVVTRTDLVDDGHLRLLPALQASGQRIVETGAANRVSASDVREAIGDPEETGVQLVVRLSGSEDSERPTLTSMLAMAADAHIPLLLVAPSGAINTTAGHMGVRQALEAGVDVVASTTGGRFGGPEGGWLAGPRPVMEDVRRTPLFTALHMDRMRLAALEATIASHERTTHPLDLPVVAMQAAELPTLELRASRIAAAIGERDDLTTGSGGGDAWVDIHHAEPEKLLDALASGELPVVAGSTNSAVRLHVRTIPPTRDESVALAVRRALS